MSDRDQLLAMGFDSTRVDWALKATSNRGLQPAMDHILENESNPVPDLNAVAATPYQAPPVEDLDMDEEDAAAVRAALGKSAIASGSGEGAASGAGDGEAKSIKCSECGKIFKNAALANFHAEKSGHDQFEESVEEIKPLTEEEKKAKLEELRVKMAEKRAKKAKEDEAENRANELIRRKAGQDQTAAKEELKLKQIAKEQEQKRREKVAEAKAKAEIKAQIEADKKARAEKAAKEKALREGRVYVEASATGAASTSTPIAPASVNSGVKGSEYKETRLQVRFASGGAPVTLTLPSDQTLHDVSIALVSKDVPIEIDTVTYSQTFPRKIFTRAEFGKSLKELGLTPSAVLQVS